MTTKQIIILSILLLTSCVLVKYPEEVKSERVPTKYDFNDEYYNNNITRIENEEAVCYILEGFKETSISCFHLTK